MDMKNIVFIKDNKLVTNSLVLADEFGRRHNNVMSSINGLIDRGRLGVLDFKRTNYIDVQNKNRPLIELSERGFLIAMPFIGGVKSEQGQMKLVDAFLEIEMREQLQDTRRRCQQELHDFELECQHSKAKASIAGKALNDRKHDIPRLERKRVFLQDKFQMRLALAV